MKLLGLDLNMRSGWALGPPDARPELGCLHLTPCKGDYGRLVAEFDERVAPMLDQAGAVAYEQPIVYDHENLHVKMITAGLAAHLELMSLRRGLQYMSFPPMTLKKRLTGHGFAKKPQMVEAARQLGYQIDDDEHDQADALACWYCLVAKFDKAHQTNHLTQHLDPLFQRI